MQHQTVLITFSAENNQSQLFTSLAITQP